MRRFLLCAILFMGWMVIYPLGWAGRAEASPDPIYTSWRSEQAVGGYDVISFYSGRPRLGKAEFQTRYKGALWLFASQANRELFLTNPAAFEPQYGGYCAWAVAFGRLAKGDPEYWHVEDGRLYLNFNARIQEKWAKDRAGYIRLADEKWPQLIGGDD